MMHFCLWLEQIPEIFFLYVILLKRDTLHTPKEDLTAGSL